LHGSWNRALRTGYKIVRLLFKDGKPTGEYQDFVIGFVANQENVWGRPVDVAFAQDGSLLFSDDGNGVVYRVTYSGK
jgi:glucose/arabinose dehydrogenase